MPARMKNWTVTLVGVALLLIAAGLAWPPLSTSIAIDSCLDMGGSFDYAARTCDLERRHPYAPEDSTMRLLVGALFAVAGSAITIFGRYVGRRSAGEH